MCEAKKESERRGDHSEPEKEATVRPYNGKCQQGWHVPWAIGALKADSGWKLRMGQTHIVPFAPELAKHRQAQAEPRVSSKGTDA